MHQSFEAPIDMQLLLYVKYMTNDNIKISNGWCIILYYYESLLIQIIVDLISNYVFEEP